MVPRAEIVEIAGVSHLMPLEDAVGVAQADCRLRAQAPDHGSRAV
jgi:hypothetical protein